MKKNRSLRLQTQESKTLFGSKIHGLATLRQRLPGAVLVAFDTEGISQQFLGRMHPNEDVSELGVAVMQPSELHMKRDLTDFYESNEIEAFTVRMRERSYGPVVGMMTEKTEYETGPRLHQFLSEIIGNGEHILLGFDMHVEWKWISRNFPSLAGLFTGWCDMQELVAQSFEQRCPHPDKITTEAQYPSLANSPSDPWCSRRCSEVSCSVDRSASQQTSDLALPPRQT